MGTVVDWGLVVALLLLASHGWFKAKGKGKWAIALLLLFIISCFASAAGERYFLIYKSLPFAFGFGDEFVHRQEWAPVGVLFSLGLLVYLFVRAPVGMATKKWSADETKPGTFNPHFPSFLATMFAMYLIFLGGSYITMAKGYMPGRFFVGTISDIAHGGGTFISEVGSEINDRFEDVQPAATQQHPQQKKNK